MNTTSLFGAVAKLADRLLSKRPRTPAGRHQPVLVIVEGRHDIEFLMRIGALLAAQHVGLPDPAELERAGKLIFIPAGGDFGPWCQRLAGFRCAELHIYDREVPPLTQQRLATASAVNRRPGCRAFVTRHRSLENYLHADAIWEARGIKLAFSGQDDVAAMAAQAVLSTQSSNSWESLSRRARQRLRNKAKGWLNTTAVDQMTPARLAERDPAGEIQEWLSAIGHLAERH